MLSRKNAAEPLVLAFHAGVIYTFARTDEETTSIFGGETIALPGISHGPKPIHTLARLSFPHGNGEILLPLLYGFCYSGCDMEYAVVDSNHCELRAMTPTQSSVDWPYPDYPDTFPVVPLAVSTRPGTYADFARNFPNLPDEPTADLIVLVPPPENTGVSLWGEWGDAEGVTVVFECDMDRKIIRAYNVCS